MPSLTEYAGEALRKGYSEEEIRSVLLQKGYSQKEISEAFRNFQPKRKTEINESRLSPTEKVGRLFSNPKSFFSDVREPSIKSAFLLVLGVGFLVTLLNIGVSYLFSVFLAGRYSMLGILGGYFGFFSFFLFIIMLGILFLYAGVAHLTLNLMGGTGRYTDTYTACAYGSIPPIIVSIVPVIGIFASVIYLIVLATIGLSAYHQVSKTKAAVAALIPFAIAVVITILFVLSLLAAFRGF